MKQRRAEGPLTQVLLLSLLPLVSGLFADGAQGRTRMVPEVYPTIQDALDAAAEHDTVLISAGTYRGPRNRNLSLNGHNLVITSRDGPEQTIIDCENAGRGFDIEELQTPATRIQGLTIENGYAVGQAGDGWGGGIMCGVASPIIRDCRILNCHANDGAGLNLGDFAGTVDHCVIAGNTADRDGGGILIWNSGPVTISDCVITGNTSHRYGVGGGVAFSGPATNTLVGCTISANSSERVGGGVIANHLDVIRTIIQGNCAPEGAAMYLGYGASVSCSDVDSAGIYVVSGSNTYTDCVFTDPLFCGPVPCGQTTDGNWTLDGASPCLPGQSPCGQLIGALEQGCGVTPPTGACCQAGGVCVVESAQRCSDEHGTYIGDSVPCLPNPCLPTSDVTIRGESATWGRIKMRFGGTK